MLKVLKTCWRGLDFLRRLTLNLVFLLILGAIVFAFFLRKARERAQQCRAAGDLVGAGCRRR